MRSVLKLLNVFKNLSLSYNGNCLIFHIVSYVTYLFNTKDLTHLSVNRKKFANNLFLRDLKKRENKTCANIYLCNLLVFALTIIRNGKNLKDANILKS